MTIRVRDIWIIVAAWWALTVAARAMGYDLGPGPKDLTRATFFALALTFHAWVFRAR